MGDSVFKNLSDPKAFANEVKTVTDLAQKAIKDPSSSKAFLEELNNIDPRKDLPKIMAEINKTDSQLAGKMVSKNEEPQELLIASDPFKNIVADVSTSALKGEKPLALTYVRNGGWQADSVADVNSVRHQVLGEKYPDQKQELNNLSQNFKAISDAFKKKS